MAHIAMPSLMTAIHDNLDTSTADFDAVVRSFQPKIFRFVLASLRDRDAAETITQDCFLKAYKSWDTFRNECSLNTWLMQIAVNLVRDHVRNRRLQFWKRTKHQASPVEGAASLPGHRNTPETHALMK